MLNNTVSFFTPTLTLGLGVLRRSRFPFQTRLSTAVPDAVLPPPSLGSYRLHPVTVPPAFMQASPIKGGEFNFESGSNNRTFC